MSATLDPLPDGGCLVSATANSNRLYVELHGLDDNTTYNLPTAE